MNQNLFMVLVMFCNKITATQRVSRQVRNTWFAASFVVKKRVITTVLGAETRRGCAVVESELLL